jgi:hypothetical protein
LVVGATRTSTRYHFRKKPFARRHVVSARVSTLHRSLFARYRGQFTETVGAWHMAVDASLESPGSVYNYYGLGNETVEARSRAYYEAEFARVQARPLLWRSLGQGATVRVGPDLAYVDVREDEGGFVTTPQAGVSDGTFGRLVFGGLAAGLHAEAVDREANPRQGFRWLTDLTARAPLSKSADAYARASSALTLYVSPSLGRQFTVAARVGATHLVGSFPFFDAATLGSRSGLRGYRSTRFAGRTSAFQNLEVRAEVTRFAGLLGYGELGVLAFFDNGRVWADGEDSDVWHQGYGGGLWAYVFDAAAVTASYGHSAEGGIFRTGVGFAF